MNKIIAVIPAYNEGQNIEDVVMGTQRYVDKVLVVDDYSTDNTVEIARKAGAKVLQKKANRGKGDSLKKGFDYAVNNGFDFVLVLDADGEHKPSEIPLFLKNKKEYDIVVGQRKQYRSFDRRIINYFSNFWFRLLIPGIRDMYCGFRLIKVDILRKVNLSRGGFELEAEMLLEAVKHNARIGLVNITTNPLEKSHFKISDYIKTNNLYDRWIIKNIHNLRIGFFRTTFLFIFANIGLLLFRWFE